MSFGVLTLATPNDYLKAIGLSLSLRVSNPGIPLAIACSQTVRPLVEPYFDYVIDEDTSLKGFAHKVYLDHYSPFDTTFFFDSDVLVFRSLLPVLEKWGKQPYTARGQYKADGFSSFGLDRKNVLKKINKPKLVVIDGAGHALFHKPYCASVFTKAREITEQYREYAGNIKYADEDVMAIAMTMLDLSPAPCTDFSVRHLSAKPGTLVIDAIKGICRLKEQLTHVTVEPCMMHFAANEAPFTYTRQLFRLYKHFNVPTDGLIKMGLEDYYSRHIKDPISLKKASIKKFFKTQ